MVIIRNMIEHIFCWMCKKEGNASQTKKSVELDVKRKKNLLFADKFRKITYHLLRTAS